MKLNKLARRDFLKLGGLGLASLFAPARALDLYLNDPCDVWQGRVTAKLLWTYERPSYEAARVKMFWRDLVVPITNVAIGEDEMAHNRVWYEIGSDGYAYSGNLQPVRTILHDYPPPEIPESGLLAEVTVPYTDAFVKLAADSEVAYRLYYETTYWVAAVETNPQDGKFWYRIYDDKFDEYYYAPAAHLRIVPDNELLPLSAEVPERQKRVEVRLNDQLMIAYEYDNPVFVTRVSSGGIFRAGKYTTPTGSFMTFHKRPTRHMAAGDIASSGYDLPGVPWVLYITESGIAFHGTYWHNDFGRPRSHGCINLTIQAAKWLYRWTTPLVEPSETFAYEHKGTKVEIHV